MLCKQPCLWLLFHSFIQPDSQPFQWLKSHCLRRTRHGLVNDEVLIPALFLLCPSGGRLCYTNCQWSVKSGQPCIMDGAKSTLFLDCSSHGAAVQCIVFFTVLVRPNKAWYNWQHCFPKCKYLSRHTAKAFMIKWIVEGAYFIKQNPPLLGKCQSNNHLDQWISTGGSWPEMGRGKVLIRLLIEGKDTMLNVL